MPATVNLVVLPVLSRAHRAGEVTGLPINIQHGIQRVDISLR